MLNPLETDMRALEEVSFTNNKKFHQTLQHLKLTKIKIKRLKFERQLLLKAKNKKKKRYLDPSEVKQV
jgi:hypothetical protein